MKLPITPFESLSRELRAEMETCGFKLSSGGAHISRTMMLAEIRKLVETSPSTASLADYRKAIVERNVLGKATATTRIKTFKLLHELYLLSSTTPLFAIYRDLILFDPESAPLLSLLAAWARDPLLRATTSVVLGADIGSVISGESIRQAVEKTFPDKYSPASLGTASRNAASTWTQSGHLEGHVRKVRRRVCPTPAAMALALCLARASGSDGEGLYSSVWCRLLDISAKEARDLASHAHRDGLITLKAMGPTVEIGFPRFAKYLGGIR